MKSFSMIVAADETLGIGREGKLPWHLPADMAHFKELTTATESPALKNVVVMGRKTWESIPEKFRPLAGRINIVLTRNASLSFPTGVLRAKDLNDALALTEQHKKEIESVYVIGGAQVFKEGVEHPRCQKIYMTHILSRFECDVFFPSFQKIFAESLASPHFTEKPLSYYFAVYQRI